MYAVIMAGGSGTRFWPLSRRSRPKQLLPLAGGDESLLAATVRRIAPLVPLERVLVVTGSHLADAVAADLPGLPAENLLAEPVGRNTAPCVGWAAATVRRRDPTAVLAVLPSDHHVTDDAGFRAVVSRAAEAAGAGDLVTIGITPTRPETGFGYVEVGEAIGPGVHRAVRFVEKPDLERARGYVASGRFLWNGGMFFFRADVVLDEIERQLPRLADGLRALDRAAALGREGEAVADEYGALPAVSFDHGVMEHARRVAVVPASFGWSDLGSWTSAWELGAGDAEGNVAPDGAVLVDAAGAYVVAPPGKLVALVGVRDLVVVDTGDALLVMPRERAQDVRHVVAELERRGDERR